MDVVLTEQRNVMVNGEVLIGMYYRISDAIYEMLHKPILL